MKILVTFALDAEFARWRQLRGFRKIDDAPFQSYGTRFGASEVRVALSGVGSENARRVLRQALAFVPDVCILSGFVAGLKAAYQVGDIVAPARVRHVRGGSLLRCEATLLQPASALGARQALMLLTTDEIIPTSEDKCEFGSIADVADMESFACLEETAVRSIPTVVLRAVSDSVDDNLPLDFDSILDESGAIRPWRVACQLARRPHRVPALLRLGWQSRRAAHSLANFLDSFVQYVSEGAKASEAVVEAACG